MLQEAINFVEKKNIHFINVLFLSYTLIIVIFASLLATIEKSLPNSIRQTFRYGKHQFQGPQNFIVSMLEVPKAWFKHFYVTAFLLSGVTLALVLVCVAYETTAPEFVLQILDLVTAGPTARKVQVESSLMVIVIMMFFTQCARRFYETHYLQIFSKTSKINISHYFVGHFHYIGSTLAIIAYADGFVRGTKPVSFDTQYTWFQFACIYFFYIAWVFQFNSNKILVNLRQDKKTGKVKTEKHLMPTGGLFEYVSCPHMLTEVILYLCLWGLMPHNTTWMFVVTWVIGNQVMTALFTHSWYKETFKNYPKNRKAIIPFIL